MTCNRDCNQGRTCECEERDRQSAVDEFWSLLIQAAGAVLICAVLGLTIGVVYGVMR